MALSGQILVFFGAGAETNLGRQCRARSFFSPFKNQEMQDSNIVIKTNNHWRELVLGFEIPEKKMEYFKNLFDNAEEIMFVKYGGEYYPLGDFMRIGSFHSGLSKENSPFGPYWDGYHSFGFGCGLLIKMSECGEACQIARYY